MVMDLSVTNQFGEKRPVRAATRLKKIVADRSMSTLAWSCCAVATVSIPSSDSTQVGVPKSVLSVDRRTSYSGVPQPAAARCWLSDAEAHARNALRIWQTADFVEPRLIQRAKALAR